MPNTLYSPSLILTFFVAISVCQAQEKPMISIQVGKARITQSVVAFPNLDAPGDFEGKVHGIQEVVISDLTFSGFINFLNPAAFVEDPKKAGMAPGTFRFSDWSSVGAEFLVKGKGSIRGGSVSVEIFVYAVHSERQILSKRYQAKEESVRKLAHTISNDLMLAFTGKKGPFTSKIAFVSDKNGKKEIYLMDYDGHNRVKVTSRFSHAMSPAWSTDGKNLLFTAITKNSKNVRNHNLFLYHLSTGTISMLSNRTGINSGAVYNPEGNQIALTMSFTGDSDIYLMDLKSKALQQITSSFGIDVDPSWSPDGKQIAFVSSRFGRPMVCKMNSDGSNVERLTFAGEFNATPSWSPTGNKIAFAGWDAGKTDIFIMNPDGSSLERLTENSGINEDPAFAPDGFFIAYASKRNGTKNIYVTNIDKTAERQITSGFGNCETPRWSPMMD